jgi:hypothetical protein
MSKKIFVGLRIVVVVFVAVLVLVVSLVQKIRIIKSLKNDDITLRERKRICLLINIPTPHKTVSPSERNTYIMKAEMRKYRNTSVFIQQ